MMQHQVGSYLSRITTHFKDVNLAAPKFTIYEETLYERQLFKDFRSSNKLINKEASEYVFDKSGANRLQSKNSATSFSSRGREENIIADEIEEESSDEMVDDDNYYSHESLENDVIIHTLSSLPTDQVLLKEETALPTFTKMCSAHKRNISVNRRIGNNNNIYNNTDEGNNINKTVDNGSGGISSEKSINDENISEVFATHAHSREFSVLLCILQRPPSSYRWNTNFIHFLQTLWRRDFLTELLNLISTQLECRSAVNEYDILQEYKLLQLYCEVLLFYVYHCNRCNALHKNIAIWRQQKNDISKSRSSSKENNLFIFEESSVMRVMHILECVLFTHTQQYATEQKYNDNTKIEQIAAMLVFTVLEMMTTNLSMSFYSEVTKLLEGVFTSFCNDINNKAHLNSTTQSEYYNKQSTQNGSVVIFVLLSAFTQLAEVEHGKLVSKKNQRLEREHYEQEEMGSNAKSSTTNGSGGDNSGNNNLVRESIIVDNSTRQEAEHVQQQQEWMHRALMYFCNFTQYDFDLSESFRYDGPHSPALTLVSGKFSRTLERFLSVVNTSIWTYFTPLALQQIIKCLPRYAYEWETKIPLSLQPLINHLHDSITSTATLCCKVSENFNDNRNDTMHNNDINHLKSFNLPSTSLNKIDSAKDAGDSTKETFYNSENDNRIKTNAAYSEQGYTYFTVHNLILYYNALAILPYVKDEFNSWQHLLRCHVQTLHKLELALCEIDTDTKSICSNSEFNKVKQYSCINDNVNLLEFAIEILEHTFSLNNAILFSSAYAANISSTSNSSKVNQGCEEYYRECEEEEEEEQQRQLQQQKRQQKLEQCSKKEMELIRSNTKCTQYSTPKDKVKQKIILSQDLLESAFTFLHALLLCYHMQLGDVDMQLCSKGSLLRRVLTVCRQIVNGSNSLRHSIKIEKMALSLLERYASVVEEMLMREEIIPSETDSIIPVNLLYNYHVGASDLHRLLLRLYMNAFRYRRMRSWQICEENSTFELCKETYCASKTEILNLLRRIYENRSDTEHQGNWLVAKSPEIHRYEHWITCVVFILHYLEKMNECDNANSAHNYVNQKRFTSSEKQSSFVVESSDVGFNASLYVSCLMQCVTTLHELLQAGEVYVSNMSVMHLLQVALQLLQSIFVSSSSSSSSSSSESLINDTDQLSPEIQSESIEPIEQLLLTRVDLVNCNSLGSNNNSYNNNSNAEPVKSCQPNASSAFLLLLRMLFNSYYSESINELIAELVLAALSRINTMKRIANKSNVVQNVDEQLYLSIRSMHTMKELQQFAMTLHNVVEAETNTKINALRLKVLYQLHQSSPRIFLLFAGSESIPENASATCVNDLRLVKILVSRIRDNVKLSFGNATSTTPNSNNNNNNISTFSYSTNSTSACATGIANTNCKESLDTRLPYNNSYCCNYNVNNSIYQEKAIAFDLLSELGAYNSVTIVECEAMLNAMSNLDVMDTQAVTQDINLNGDTNNKKQNIDIDNNINENVDEANPDTMENRGALIINSDDNNNMSSTNSTNTTCAVTLCISSIIRYIASCIVHEIQYEQAENNAHELLHWSEAGYSPSKTRNGNSLTRDSGAETNANTNTPLHLGRTRNSVISVYSDFIDHAIQISLTQLNRLSTNYTAIRLHLEKIENTRCYNENDEILITATNISEEKFNGIYNNAISAFTGHDNVHVAYATPVNITPDISFQFTDNQYEASSRSSSTQNSSETTEERYVQEQQLWEKQKELQRGVKKGEWHDETRHGDKEKQQPHINNLYDFNLVQLPRGNNKMNSMEVVDKRNVITMKETVYSNDHKTIESESVAHYLCPLLCGADYYFHGSKYAALLNIAASCLMCMRALCARLTLLVQIKGDDNDVNVLFITRSVNLIKTALSCAFLYRPSHSVVLSSIAPLELSLLEHALTLAHTAVIRSNPRYLLYQEGEDNNNNGEIDNVSTEESTLITSLRPTLHTLVSFVETYVMSYPAILNHGIPLLSLLNPYNLHDTIVLPKLFIIISSVLRSQNENEHDAQALLTSSNCNAVIESCELVFHRFGTNCPTLTKLSIVQCVWQRIMSTMHCVSANDNYRTKPVTSFHKLLRLLMTILTFTTSSKSSSSSSSSELVYLLSAIRQDEFFAFLTAFEEYHTFTSNRSWSSRQKQEQEVRQWQQQEVHEHSFAYRPAWQYVWCTLIKFLTTIITSLHTKQSVSAEVDEIHSINNSLTHTSGWLHHAQVFVSTSVRYREAISALADYDSVNAIMQYTHLSGATSTQVRRCCLHFWQVEEVYLCTRLLALLQSHALHLTEFIPIVQSVLAVYCRSQENVRASQIRTGALNSSSVQTTPVPHFSHISPLPLTTSSQLEVLALQTSSALKCLRTESNVNTELANSLEWRLCKVFLTHIARDQFTFLLNQIDHLIYTQGELKRVEHSNSINMNNTVLLPNDVMRYNSNVLTLDLLCNYTIHQLNRLRRSGIWDKTSKSREFNNFVRNDSIGSKSSTNVESLTSSRETSVTRTPSIGFADTNSNIGGEPMDDAIDDINNSFANCSFNNVKMCEHRPIFAQTNEIFTQRRQQEQVQQLLEYDQHEILDTLRAFREDIRGVYVDSAQLSLCLFTLAAEEMSKRLCMSAAALTVMPQKRELTILCDKLLYTLNVLCNDLKKTSMTPLLNIVRVMQHRLNNKK